uniref:Gustatory receptor for bitter taste 66a-like n=1 Tax=Diabrotica virgifera virgifera TaxID=50390 RepID=A0A6P7H0N5_DIAVI
MKLKFVVKIPILIATAEYRKGCLCFKLQVYIFYIAFSSDKVSRAAENLITTCYLLHPNAEDQVLTEELTSLSRFMQDLFPEMSVAGWFTLNKSFVLVLISSLTSYIIIIIQFELQ